MTCLNCGAENAPAKKCCYRCGAVLSGYTINNVTGEYGYRNHDGSFSLTLPYEPEEIIVFDAPQMEYDPQTMTARFFQNYNIKITQEVIQFALLRASDKQLKEELKRRADERRFLKGQILRCRDCKHCIQGYTSRYAAYCGCQTSVCKMRSKGNAEWDCFYSTLQSRKACEQFESKLTR